MGHFEKNKPQPAPKSYRDMEDSVLITLVAEQDRLAFAELFGRYGGKVKGFLMRLQLASDQAEDIMQEVMVTVWRRAESYDSQKASFPTWLFTIARNRRIDAARRAARREPDPNDPMFERDPEPDGQQLLSAAEREKRVRAAYQALPEAQRDVIRLAFFEGLSHGECAERLDLPLGTVKSRIRLAFQRLRDSVGAEFQEELRDS